MKPTAGSDLMATNAERKTLLSLSRGNRGRKNAKKPISPGRHAFHCSICTHASREEIEIEFVNWSSPARIAKEFRVSRDSVYRHAHALSLFEKRRRNVRVALERIIENAGEVAVGAAAVVSAVAAYAKINASGQWIERTEQVSLNQLFDRMTREEMEAYARDGRLPAWFDRAVGATDSDSPDASRKTQLIE
jgi:hypothetical protein